MAGRIIDDKLELRADSEDALSPALGLATPGTASPMTPATYSGLRLAVLDV
jgi:hypothetical protein